MRMDVVGGLNASVGLFEYSFCMHKCESMQFSSKAITITKTTCEAVKTNEAQICAATARNTRIVQPFLLIVFVNVEKV